MTKEEYEKYAGLKVQFATIEKLRCYISTIHDIRKEYSELENALREVEIELCNIYRNKEVDLAEQLNKI